MTSSLADAASVPFPDPRPPHPPGFWGPRRLVAAVAAAAVLGTAGGAAVTYSVVPRGGGEAVSVAEGIDGARDAVYRIAARGQTGTGMLIREDLVLTNFHVISDLMTAGATFKDPVSLTTVDGDPVEGHVVMSDPGLDVALIRIPPSRTEPLTLVGSDGVRAGDPVSVLGFPFGLSLSAGVGAVGAVDQATSLRASPLQSSLLQLSLSVNPGNSGGPVIDSKGQVLGMVTFRPDEVGGRAAQGMSFAVPAEDILISVAQWEEHGNVSYGLLGAALTQDTARPEVRSVTAGGPAERGGLVEGDVVVAVNGTSTPTFAAVSRALHERRPGDKVDLMVMRRGEQTSVIVELGDSGRE